MEKSPIVCCGASIFSFPEASKNGKERSFVVVPVVQRLLRMKKMVAPVVRNSYFESKKSKK
jgi:hypothetical protein